jgi:hypothetical protein
MTTKQVFNTSAELNYPTVLPTLDLDFANSKTLDPRITFTRSSGGSYVGADGLMKIAGVNEPRFDHDLTTGESLGLLIEEPRTNLINGSDIVGTVGSTPTGAVVPYTAEGQSVVVSTDVFLGPNGQSAKHTKGSQQGDTNIGYYTASGLTVGQTYCASIWLYIPSSQAKNFAGKLITFQAEPISSFTNISTASYNTNLVDVWQRAFCVFTAGITNVTIIPRTNAGAGSFFYTDAWQLELGSFPTSYIPTVASTRTRAADNAQITGTNFSSWYNQAEGTVSISCSTRMTPNIGNATDFLISNSFTTTYTSRIVGWFNIGPAPFISVFVNNINILLPFIGVPGSSSNIPIKKAIALATRNMRVATNGTIITGNLGNTTVPNYLPNDFNRLLLGFEGIFAGYLNGTISRFTYYPKALSNSQLQALTR